MCKHDIKEIEKLLEFKKFILDYRTWSKEKKEKWIFEKWKTKAN